MLPWPLPALLAWALAWSLFLTGQRFGLSTYAASATACALGVGLSLVGNSWWRRILIALGFPVSLALSGLAAAPAWGWLLPLGVLLLIYPLHAWRDAPLFPTPRGALRELAAQVPLAPGAQVLDAGCGLGDGLRALRQAYPLAQLHGIERSALLRWVCALRCPWALLRHGDMWQAPWSGHALVYLFQRPESMHRAAEKARTELRPGAWLVSLEFEAPSLQPHARLVTPDGRALWLYRAPLQQSG